MKKIALLLILLMLVPAAFAKTISTGIAELTVPDAWESQEFDGGMFVAINPDAEDAIRVNVNLIQETLPSAYTAAQYKEAASNGLKSILKDIKFLKSEGNWHIVEYSYEGYMLRQLQYFYVKGTTGCVLTFTASQKAFADNEKLFRQIEGSLKLK